MNSAYALRSPLFLTNTSSGISFLRDAPSEERKNRVDFHVHSGDYFGTLSTILALMADALSTNDAENLRRCIRTLAELHEDLAYLQDAYSIERKAE